jgi:hypothetical protein
MASTKSNRGVGDAAARGEETDPGGSSLPADNKIAKKCKVLPEPVIVSEFWANRHGVAIRVQLREFEGHSLIDIRKHFTNGEGKLQATPKGIALAIARLPKLAAAVNQALAKARELGLIEEAGHD